MLHTLTLIQRNAEYANQVRRLARAQERDLRAWLYKPEGTGKDEADEPTTLAEAVRRNAAEVEDKHGVPIEVVVVGDRPLDEGLTAQMQAAREAMVNAAKYGGEGGAVQVYAEVEGRTVFVSVRHRGPGFDLDGYPPTAWALENRSSAAWSATAARRDCARCRTAARRSSWRWKGRRRRHERRDGPTGQTPASNGPEDAAADGWSSAPGPTTAAVAGAGAASAGEDAGAVVPVDDHRMFRTGVQAEIGETEPDSRRRGGRRGRGRRPGGHGHHGHPAQVVLLDVHLPGGGGVEVLRRCAPLMADARRSVSSLRSPCRTPRRTSSV